MTTDTRLRLAAALCGVVPITAFIVLANRAREMVPVILSQKVIPNPTGPRLLEINFLPPPNIPKPAPGDDEEPMSYRIVDQTGRQFGNGFYSSRGPAPVFIRLETDYGRTPDHPRLEVFMEGKKQGSLELAPFPAPIDRKLPTKPDPRIEASFGSGIEAANIRFSDDNANHVLSGIKFRALSPVRPDEVWKIQSLESNISSRPGSVSFLSKSSAETLAAPSYPEDIRAVRVRVEKHREEISSDEIVLPPVRLEPFGKQFDFVAIGTSAIPNKLGLNLRLAPRLKIPSDVLEEDRHAASIYLSFAPDRTSVVQDFKEESLIFLAENKLSVCTELLSPSLQTLGLSTFYLNGRLIELPPGQKRGPRIEGPVTFRIRLQTLRWKTTETFETTIPVAPPKS